MVHHEYAAVAHSAMMHLPRLKVVTFYTEGLLSLGIMAGLGESRVFASLSVAPEDHDVERQANKEVPPTL